VVPDFVKLVVGPDLKGLFGRAIASGVNSSVNAGKGKGKKEKDK
jgi:hypothetical protein